MRGTNHWIPRSGCQDIGSCLAQTQVFTSESLLVYGTCLQEIECDDLALRLDCMAKLRFVDRSNAENACESLIQYATKAVRLN